MLFALHGNLLALKCCWCFKNAWKYSSWKIADGGKKCRKTLKDLEGSENLILSLTVIVTAFSRKRKNLNKFGRVSKSKWFWCLRVIYNKSFFLLVIFCLHLRQRVWVVGLRTWKFPINHKAIAQMCLQQKRHSHCIQHNRSSQHFITSNRSSTLIVSRKLLRWVALRVPARKILAISIVTRNYCTVTWVKETLVRRHPSMLRTLKLLQRPLQERQENLDRIGLSSSVGCSTMKLLTRCTASIVGNGVEISQI